MNQKSIYPKVNIDNIFVISFICCLIAVWCLQTSAQFEHWFLVPVILNGIVIGIDALNWFRGRLNLFDPVGILGLLGFHFFFLTPLLHVIWDMWLSPWFDFPPDWRPWLGGMAILNLFGLLAYHFCRRLVSEKPKNQTDHTVWLIDSHRFRHVIGFAMMLSAILQIIVYRQFGGIMGYIASATGETDSTFKGMGIVFLFSESFPILAMMTFAVYAQRNKRLQSWSILILVLLVFLILQMLFGGLRGSRSNTIWALFWAVGIIHFMLRPVTKREVAVGLAFLLFFMYLYGFFKSNGLAGVEAALKGDESRIELEEKSGRTWKGMLLGDLGRSDIQSYLLYRLIRTDSDYEYAWGETYLAATTILIPKAIVPNRPFKSKVMQGTELSFGKNSYKVDEWESENVYGIAGEAMLNFGPFAVPFAYIPLALLVGWVKRCLFTWKSSDSRLMLLPMLVNLCFVVLVGDFDNVIFFLVKNSGFPTLVIWLGSRKKIYFDQDNHNFREALYPE